MTSKYHSVNSLKVSEELLHFVNNELFDGTDISPDKFWKDFDKAVHELATKNRELIDFRETLQKKINKWHIDNKGKDIQIKEYKNFLKEIGYLKDEGPDFKIETNNIFVLSKYLTSLRTII